MKLCGSWPKFLLLSNFSFLFFIVVNQWILTLDIHLQLHFRLVYLIRAEYESICLHFIC